MVAARPLVMEYALLTHDFSVSYVAQVGSRAVPTWVTIVSLWSSLEGSILFWGFVLGIYIAVATWLTRDQHAEYMPYAIGDVARVRLVLQLPHRRPGAIRSTPSRSRRADGPGPNPLLQNHFLMVDPPAVPLPRLRRHDHPVRLRDCAALLRGRLGLAFLRPLRNVADAAVDLPHHRHHARRLVGVRSPRLGRLLGVGSGRERVAPAVAHRDRRAALARS